MFLSHSVVVAQKMYWIETTRGIYRADLDGENPEVLLSVTLFAPSDIAVDSVAGKIYCTDSITQKIQRVNFDGTNVEDIVTTGLSYLRGIAVDGVGGKIYWS